MAPIAHRDDNDKWVYYVGDPNGASVDLVDGDGEAAGALRRSAFGKVIDQTGVTTDARAPAQLEDEETGLLYNRYRYYDPETGRFLNPDPIGLDGGLNEYAYGPNPVGWFDAMGWAGHMLTVTSSIDGVPSGPYGDGYPSGWSDENDPHCPPDLRSEARCHSERKLIRDLENAAARNPGTPLGGSVTASGRLPPCPNCHRAMRRFARENGTTIRYQCFSGGIDLIQSGRGQRSTRLAETTTAAAGY